MGSAKYRSELESDVIGMYGKGRRNKGGQDLIDWCVENDAVIGNTCFKHPCRHRTTWNITIRPPGHDEPMKVLSQPAPGVKVLSPELSNALSKIEEGKAAKKKADYAAA